MVSQLVTDSGAATTRDDIQYQANRDGAPQFAEGQPAVTLGRSSLYTYDDLSRLTQADVGRLNGGRTDILTEWSDPTQIVYTMDILGNITTLNRKNSGVSANETRTYNATNELLTRAVTGESKRLWVFDDFTDNDTTGWATADADGDGTVDGSWSAGSGALSCAGVASISGSPDSGTGSILLIDGEARNDFRINCTATLDTNCENAGIVYGYIDGDNFWVSIYSKATQTLKTYEVSAGTWTEKSSTSKSISNATPFEMTVRIGAGRAGNGNVSGTVPAGGYGVWCSDASDNTIDSVEIRDLAGPFVADARWFSSFGDVQIDEANDNVLTADAEIVDHEIVRRGSRAGQYEMTFKLKWNTTSSPGCLVRWLAPGDWLAIAVADSDGKPRIYERKADGSRSVQATSSTALSLTNGNWYTAKVTVDDDGAGGDRLRFWVDVAGDGFGNDTEHFNDTSVIDDWPAGCVGLYVGPQSTDATEFDDVTMKIDADADGTIDEQQFADDFDSNHSCTTTTTTWPTGITRTPSRRHLLRPTLRVYDLHEFGCLPPKDPSGIVCRKPVRPIATIAKERVGLLEVAGGPLGIGEDERLLCEQVLRLQVGRTEPDGLVEVLASPLQQRDVQPSCLPPTSLGACRAEHPQVVVRCAIVGPLPDRREERRFCGIKVASLQVDRPDGVLRETSSLGVVVQPQASLIPFECLIDATEAGVGQAELVRRQPLRGRLGHRIRPEGQVVVPGRHPRYRLPRIEEADRQRADDARSHPAACQSVSQQPAHQERQGH